MIWGRRDLEAGGLDCREDGLEQEVRRATQQNYRGGEDSYEDLAEDRRVEFFGVSSRGSDVHCFEHAQVIVE